MLQSCKYCGRVHKLAFMCPDRPKAWARKETTRVIRFRNSAAWRRKRTEIQERDHYLCAACLDGRVINYSGLSVHHIEPLSERFDLRLSDSNLITLCKYHHNLADDGLIDCRELARHEKTKSTPPAIGFAPKDRVPTPNGDPTSAQNS